MKHTTTVAGLAVGLMLIAAPLSAQYYNLTSQHNFYSSIDDLRPQADGSVLLSVRGNRQLGLNTIELEHIQPDGQRKSFLIFSEFTKGLPLDYDLMPVPGGYVATGAFFECDITDLRQLYRYDEDGNFEWRKDPAVTIDPFEKMKLFPGLSGTFWLFREHDVPLHYTADGELFESGPLALPLFTGFRPAPGNKYLTYGLAGLGLYSPELNSLQFGLQDQNVRNAEPLPDGRIYALTADTMYLLDAGFNILKSEARSASVDSFLNMSAVDNEMWVLAQTGQSKTLLRYDSTLSLQASVPIPADAPFQPRFLMRTADHLTLAGEEHPLSNTQAQVVAVRSMAPDTPDFGAAADAALLDVGLPKMPVGAQLTGQGWGGYSMSLDSAYVVLKNEGTEILDSVTVNSVFEDYNWWCGPEEQQYRQTFTGLNLDPGASMDLPLGKIDWSRPFASLPAQVTLCFWTTRPNGALDADWSNNKSCRTVSVIVSTKTPVPQTGRLEILPNPAAETSVVHWENTGYGEAQIQVYSAAGRLVQAETVTGASWTFRRGTLPAGLYHILIRNADGRSFAGRLAVE